jgi:hypothetical protein
MQEELEDVDEFKVKEFTLTDFDDLDDFVRERLEEDNDNNEANSTDEDLPDLPESELPVLAAEPFKMTPIPKKPKLV